ncbi:MAG: RuvX/YqgF family protein, partial [Candidatus Saccharimonadales bacterium]
MAAQYVLGLDYGDERVGVAIAQQIARLPRPLTTLQNNESLIDEIQLVADREDIGCVVVGVPRNMDGTESTQSRT